MGSTRTLKLINSHMCLTTAVPTSRPAVRRVQRQTVPRMVLTSGSQITAWKVISNLLAAASASSPFKESAESSERAPGRPDTVRPVTASVLVVRAVPPAPRHLTES